MEFAQRHAISDVCVLVEDLDRAVAFYVEKLGFVPLHRAPGFADFSGAGLTLALWQIDHIADHTGIARTRAPGVHKAVIAVKLPSADEVDACYAELSAKGVAFQGAPADYPWNARCAYFAGPDGEVWELYGWYAGGGIGKLD